MLQLDLNGTLVRWCQQCARFHPLEFFDGAKRSCRKKLEQHNACRKRRRSLTYKREEIKHDDTFLTSPSYELDFPLELRDVDDDAEDFEELLNLLFD